MENAKKNRAHNNSIKDELLFLFKEHLLVMGRSASTVRNYTEHVRHFIDDVCKEVEIRQVTRIMVEEYIASLYKHRTRQGKPYGLNTIMLKIRSIKRFFEHLEGSNIVFINVTESIKEPVKPRGICKEILTEGEVNKILDRPDLRTLTGIRDRTILEVFYSTGIRLTELCSLSIYDADLQGGMIRVNKGKGAKQRVVPMGSHAVKSLREYITKARPILTNNNSLERNLFVDKHSRPISTQAVRIMVKRNASLAGIKRRVTPHTFRHTFASRLVKNGADITAVQRMLGHAELKTTQVYIRSLGIDLKKAHIKSHPREKDSVEKDEIKPAIVRMRPAYE